MRSLGNKSLFVILFSLLLGAALPASAALREDCDYLRQEIRLSEFSPSAQAAVSLAEDGEGGLLAAWDSRRQQNGSYGVYGRRVGPLGQLRGSEYALNLYQESQQMHPSLAYDDQGSWAVWESWGQDGSAQASLGRSAGGNELLLSETWRGSQSQPVAASLGGGIRLAAWITPGDVAGSTRIVARLFDAQGAPLTGEIAVSGERCGNDRNASVAAGETGFVVAWTRDGFADGEAYNEIRCRRFDASGEPTGAESRVASGFEPSVARAEDGSFLIAWLANDGENARARAARFDASGARIGESFAASAGLPGWQSAVAVDYDSAGRFAIAWNQVDETGEDCDVHARLFAADGSSLSGNLRVNGAGQGWQGIAEASGAARIALGDDGRLAVAWQGDSAQGDGSAANLTLLFPRPNDFWRRMSLRGRLAMASLSRGGTGRGREALEQGAQPHSPPVFSADDIDLGLDTDPYFPGSADRDEGWQAFANTGWTPPDPHMAIGVDHVMTTVNGGLACFDRVGNQLWMTDIGGVNGFWFDIAGSGGFVFDPEVIYDPHSGRFMAMANERNGASYFLLAISATGDATGAWHKYRLNVGFAGGDIDSPNFAVDADNIYLTADFFSPDEFLIHMVDKSSVLNGGAAVTNSYTITGSQSFGIPVVYDADAPRMYMVHAPEGTSETTITLHAINDPMGATSISNFTLGVPPYWDPTSSQSQGTGTTVQLFEARFWSCVYRNGSLWACHHIAPTSSRNSSAARWYEIEMNGWPVSGDNPTLKQSGQVQPAANGWATFNSITVNQYGAAAMVFAYSSPNDFFKMMRVVRAADDPLGTMQAPVLIKESTGAYSSGRWGDYSACTVDPVDNARFWMTHEYSVSNSWRTWVSNFALDLSGLPPIGSGDLAAQIRGAYPNPCEGPTRFSFTLERAGHVAVEVFDVQGRLVRRLDGGSHGAGAGEIAWDGRDALGGLVANGQYLSRIEFDGRPAGTAGQRVTVLR